MSEFKLDFQDTATAFADKSTSELKEKYRLFKMMNSPSLVSFGTKMTNFALTLGLPAVSFRRLIGFSAFRTKHLFIYHFIIHHLPELLVIKNYALQTQIVHLKRINRSMVNDKR